MSTQVLSLDIAVNSRNGVVELKNFDATVKSGEKAKLMEKNNRNAKFQSTRPHGARHFHNGEGSYTGSFNPRARVGRDTTSALHEVVTTGFNPRARMGRDPRLEIQWSSDFVSIHAPAWGATVNDVAYL